MTFGMQVTSSTNSVQISGNSPNYVCVYSSVLSGTISTRSWLETDLIVYTRLSGAGGAHRGPSANTLNLVGSHRVTVFRRADRVNLPASNFGMEIRDEGGELVYNSIAYPLIIGVSNYCGMILQAPGFRELPSGQGVQGLSYAKFCNLNGVVSESTLRLYENPNKRNPTGASYVFSAPGVICDLSRIPLSYRTNNATGLP